MDQKQVPSLQRRSNRTAPKHGLRLIGLGDSLTQGVGDPRSGLAGFSGALDGWVSYVASAVRASGRPVEVSNFALAGARLEHVLGDQLPLVKLPTKAQPENIDVISCFVGINDLWDVNLDLDLFAERFDALFKELASRSALVMTASIHDVFAPFPMRASLRAKHRQNIATMNEIVAGAVSDYGLVLIDLAGRPEMFTSEVRALDRLHPNRYGHQLIAAEVVNQLHARGHLLNVGVPGAKPVGRGLHDLAHIAWVSGYVRQNWKRWAAESAANSA